MTTSLQLPPSPCPGCGAHVITPHYCQPQDPLTGAPPISGTQRLFDGTPIPGWSHPLRKAASEALLAGALVLADVMRDPAWKEQITKASEERFRKALEQLAEALA